MFRPFQDSQISLSALQDEMNRMFERVWHGGLSTRPFDGQQWAPAIDLYETDDSYIVHVEITGVDPKNVELTHIENTLTIRGERACPLADDDSVRRVSGERRFGTFCRSIELPGDIDGDKLSARCHGGMLEISLPKTVSSRPKSVKIKVEDE